MLYLNTIRDHKSHRKQKKHGSTNMLTTINSSEKLLNVTTDSKFTFVLDKQKMPPATSQGPNNVPIINAEDVP